jgi:ubiquinone/menaquinone biosynthesis C-methylase UbiE
MHEPSQLRRPNPIATQLAVGAKASPFASRRGSTPRSLDGRMATWADPRSAELYDRFCSEHDMYRLTSRDLVGLARVSDAALVVDLACGTGVTTEAILSEASASAEVVAVDASEEMLRIARRRMRDERVRWVCSRAVDLGQHVAGADSVVCNSAIWQLDMESAIAAAAQALRQGGRFAFNIGRQFLMLPLSPEELHPHKPSFAQLIQAVAVLNYDYAPPHPAAFRRSPMTPESVTEMLGRAGLVVDGVEQFEYEQSPEAQLAWLSVPVFADNVLPGMPHDQQLAVLAEAYDRWEKAPLMSTWLAFVSYKP